MMPFLFFVLAMLVPFASFAACPDIGPPSLSEAESVAELGSATCTGAGGALLDDGSCACAITPGANGLTGPRRCTKSPFGECTTSSTSCGDCARRPFIDVNSDGKYANGLDVPLLWENVRDADNDCGSNAWTIVTHQGICVANPQTPCRGNGDCPCGDTCDVDPQHDVEIELFRYRHLDKDDDASCNPRAAAPYHDDYWEVESDFGLTFALDARTLNAALANRDTSVAITLGGVLRNYAFDALKVHQTSALRIIASDVYLGSNRCPPSFSTADNISVAFGDQEYVNLSLHAKDGAICAGANAGKSQRNEVRIIDQGSVTVPPSRVLMTATDVIAFNSLGKCTVVSGNSCSTHANCSQTQPYCVTRGLGEARHCSTARLCTNIGDSCPSLPNVSAEVCTSGDWKIYSMEGANAGEIILKAQTAVSGPPYTQCKDDGKSLCIVEGSTDTCDDDWTGCIPDDECDVNHVYGCTTN
jgi:hypothetical protein